MLKVVHVVSTFSQGGVQTGILYSIKELQQEFDYKVLVYGKADENWLKDFPDEIKDNIIVIGSSTIAAGTIKALKLLKKMKPDVVVCSLWKSVPATIIYKSLNPSICLCGFYHSTVTFHAVDKFFLRLLGKRLDVSLTDSNATSRFIEKKLSVNNSVIVPYLFDFKIPPKTRVYDPAKIKMAYFGSLTKIKRIDRAISFCKLCKDAGIAFQFDIYGNGDAAVYNDMIEKNELLNEVHIKHVLPLDQVQTTMQEYDFLLQLSDVEGMGLAVVEGLSCGVVPLVTPVGEIAQYTKDGMNAIWLDPEFDKNLHLLVKKLSVVLRDRAMYNRLSGTASETFKGQKKYVESFASGINDFLEKRNH